MMGVYQATNLPKLPQGFEWVINADADRFTVSLAHVPVRREINPDVDNEFSEAAGYVMSHTHKHPAVMTRAEWEYQVVNAASHLWTNYTEGNRHAEWADELMRRSR
jgi:hypothetical protein